MKHNIKQAAALHHTANATHLTSEVIGQTVTKSDKIHLYHSAELVIDWAKKSYVHHQHHLCWPNSDQ